MGHGTRTCPRPSPMSKSSSPESATWLWTSPVEVRSTVNGDSLASWSLQFGANRASDAELLTSATTFLSVTACATSAFAFALISTSRAWYSSSTTQTSIACGGCRGRYAWTCTSPVAHHEGRILHGHAHDGILTCQLAADLSLYEPVLLEETQVLPMLLL